MTQFGADQDTSLPAWRELILRDWAAGKTETEIAAALGVTVHVVGHAVQRSYGPDAEKAQADHRLSKAARGCVRLRDQESFDREARVLALWAEGRVASEVGDALGISRNAVI